VTALFCFSASAFFVWLCCLPLHKELLRRQLIDRPNERSNHVVPTPRGGGIAIMSVVIVGFVFIGSLKSQISPIVLAGAALLIAIISLLDDVKPLPARVRFATHFFAALLVLGILGAKTISHFTPTLLQVLLGPVLFFWIVGYTNAFNFMDGINGIAAGQALITGLGTALIIGCATDNRGFPLLLCSLTLSGATLGFLPHNFPRARMFMGDVGSAPLGFLLAALAVATAKEFGWYLLIPLFLLHVNYIGDTSITLVRRFMRGEKVYQAHKEHFYQRLVRSGKSHVFVTGWEMILQSLTLALAILYVKIPGFSFRITIVILVMAIWSAFFTCAELTFRKSIQRSASHSSSTGERTGPDSVPSPLRPGRGPG
jgi:UDP-N-acetylmuramyl pentapeptide phosphotransferase/UDP-N-acetylglucosamine-1-phosphate transferase